MKNLLHLTLLFSVFSCTTTAILTPEEVEKLTTHDVEIIFTTTEPNYDEVMVTYYDFKNGKDIAEAIGFKYDTDGNALPLKIILENYKYELIRGEGFRNNFSTAELKVQLFIDNELVLEKKSKGNSSTFAKVIFNYDIP